MRGVVAVFRSDRTVGELEQPRGWRVERLASGAILDIPVVAIRVRLEALADRTLLQLSDFLILPLGAVR